MTASRNCTVEAPVVSLATKIGTVRLNDMSSPSRMLLWGADMQNGSGVTQIEGCIWGGRVTTPAAFTSAGPGEWNFTQTVTPHCVIQSPGTTHNWSYNGQSGLDARFPAFPTSGFYAADGALQVAGDTPDQGFRVPFTHVEAHDTLVTYMLLLPPGDGSAFVPLRRLSWFWKGQVSADPSTSNGWRLHDMDASISGLEMFPRHPEWEHNNVNGQFTPPLP